MSCLNLLIVLLAYSLFCSVPVDSQNVTCRTVGNHADNPLLFKYIELTFSEAYSMGTYNLYQAIASLTVKHIGANNRPLPVQNILYPSSTTIRLVFVNDASLAYEYTAESTTGYRYNVSFYPLVNRTETWLLQAGSTISPFSCLTIDNSPPLQMWWVGWVNGSSRFYQLYFSEPVTGNFTHSSILTLGGTITSGLAYPYLPDAQGFSRHYFVGPCNAGFLTGLRVNVSTVTDVAGNLNILSSDCSRPSYRTMPLSGKSIEPPFAPICTSTIYFSNTVSQYDLDEDGVVDTVYLNLLVTINEQTFDMTNANWYGYSTNQLLIGFNNVSHLPKGGPYSFSPLTDDNPTDNNIAFRVSVPAGDTNLYPRVSFVYSAPINFELFYVYPVNLSNIFFPFELYQPVDTKFVHFPVIQHVTARNRTCICVRVSMNSSTVLDANKFYLASHTGNSIVGSVDNSTYQTCLLLTNPLTNRVAHHRGVYWDLDLLFLEPKPYVLSSLDYYRIPLWKGKYITMSEYTPPILLFSELLADNNETTWHILRLVFDEPVNVNYDTFNISVVPYGPSSLVQSINVNMSSAIQLAPHIIDFVVSASCSNVPLCYGTDTSSLRVEHVEGFEDTFFNLLIPLVDGIITPSDSVRPILIRTNILTSYIVELVFSEPIDFAVSPAASIRYSSSTGRSFAIDPDVTGNKVSLTFNQPTSYDILTIEPCGILVRDLSANYLACDPSIPTIVTFGTPPPISSSSSSSTGGISSLSSSSSTGTWGMNNTFSTRYLSSEILGISFPLFLSIVPLIGFSIIVSFMALISYRYKQ